MISRMVETVIVNLQGFTAVVQMTWKTLSNTMTVIGTPIIQSIPDRMTHLLNFAEIEHAET
jgi:hypothetical protein